MNLRAVLRGGAYFLAGAIVFAAGAAGGIYADQAFPDVIPYVAHHQTGRVDTAEPPVGPTGGRGPGLLLGDVDRMSATQRAVAYRSSIYTGKLTPKSSDAISKLRHGGYIGIRR